MGPIWDAELRVWDAKNFGLVSPGTHRNKFVKKSLKPINIQNGVVLEKDTVWKCVFNLVYVHDNSKGKDRGLKNQGYMIP